MQNSMGLFLNCQLSILLVSQRLIITSIKLTKLKMIFTELQSKKKSLAQNRAQETLLTIDSQRRNTMTVDLMIFCLLVLDQLFRRARLVELIVSPSLKLVLRFLISRLAKHHPMLRRMLNLKEFKQSGVFRILGLQKPKEKVNLEQCTWPSIN